MVSPRRVEKNNKKEGSRTSNSHKKYCFYLDVKNNATAKKLETRIKQLGLRVEVFLTDSVTHVISDAACSVRRSDSHPTSDRQLLPSPAPHVPSHKGTRRVGDAGARSRADAMLERVHAQPCHAPPVAPAPPSPPVLSVLKALKFLDKLYETVYKAVSPSLNVRHLKGAFIKFESFDRATRPVFKELSVWPDIATEPDQPTAITAALPQPAKEANADSQQRMTRKSRVRVKEREEVVKQSGYCEMCHADYADLAHHEKSATHVAFIKNGANFLALDTLIRAGADVEAFLGVNEHAALPDSHCERRSLRKIIKIRAEHEDKARELEVICNGTADQNGKLYSPRESCRRSIAHKPQVSPALSTDSGHFLRSKGPQDDTVAIRCSPREASKRDTLPNGAMSPRVLTDTTRRTNGAIDEDERPKRATKAGKKSRSIRWRRPSPESAPPPQEDRQYYKVVGVSTKLRSSGGFVPSIPKDEESVPRETGPTCNGEAAPLVVKFRRMRRSELSVLSDEAEQFMFPKRDDSTDTEDEVETATSGRDHFSSDVISSDTKRAARPTRLKEESSGDETSQDGFEFDFGMKRKYKRKKPLAERKYNNAKRAEVCKSESEKFTAKADGDLECDDGKGIKTENKAEKEEKVDGNATNVEPVEKCLKWEDGRLKASPEVESLEFAFERIPHSEAWYETFKRQDEDKQISKNVSQYFATYLKSPKLPYEMGQLPPLKPDCCPLSGGAPKRAFGPGRAYGTRGMKKKRVRQAQLLALERHPRKSPREHASTLAILGSLLHKRKARLTGCDDAKSVTSTHDDEASSDVPTRPDPSNTADEDRNRRLEEFLSAVFEDAAEYEVPPEAMDVDVRVDPRSSRPDVVGLLAGYEKCDAIDIAVREMQENSPLHVVKTRRRGHKTKKKNKTGWPRKKKIVVKKVRNGRSNSASSDKTETQGDAVVQDSESSSAPSEFSKTRKLSRVNEESVQVNENSITSTSDIEDKGTVSSKGKDTDTEASDSEDDAYLNSVDLKRWESAERSLGDRLSEETTEDSRHSLEMQPVVRVQKMESDIGRRLRSSASDRSNNNKRRAVPKRRATRGFWYATR